MKISCFNECIYKMYNMADTGHIRASYRIFGWGGDSRMEERTSCSTLKSHYLKKLP